MTLRPISEITITSSEGRIYTFRTPREIQITSSRYEITDTAEIKIPKNLRINDRPVVAGSDRLFKIGDRVKIRMGYHPILETHFEGYVAKVEPGNEISIKCEDASWLLKKKIIAAKTFKKVTLEELLREISPIPFKAAKADLGDLRITGASVAQVLEELRKTYGIFSWVEDGVLFSGLLYEDRNPDPVTFHFYGERGSVVDQDLLWREKGDLSVKAKAVSVVEDNKKREVEVGDPNAEISLTLFFPENLTEEGLKRAALEKIQEMDFTGFSGSFQALGRPRAIHSGIVELKDARIRERDGKYWVKKVETSYSMGGIRQAIEIDRRAL
jgi:hypothetical protein